MSSSRFLGTWLTGALLTALKVPGTLPTRCCWPHHRGGRFNGTAYKINQLQILTGNSDHNCGWTAKPMGSLGGQGDLHCPLLPLRTGWMTHMLLCVFSSRLWLFYQYSNPSIKTWHDLQRVQVTRNHKLSCAIKHSVTLLIKLSCIDSACRNPVVFWSLTLCYTNDKTLFKKQKALIVTTS